MSYGNQQLRGALLEEVILFLLKTSGYDPVTTAGVDPTLNNGPSGLEVRGRGSAHQIDAVADFKIAPPFSHPQRLLLEAKFYGSKITLPTIRNAAGVIKDVSEGWTVTGRSLGAIPRSRFHYLYAIFSASDFTSAAQDYAFAHDIYLLPLRRSSFVRPILSAIEAVDASVDPKRPKLSAVRRWVRRRLLGSNGGPAEEYIPDAMRASLDALVDACFRLRFGFITMFGGQFPAFLVAAPDFSAEHAEQIVTVRIRVRQGSWFVERTNGREVFSFDLPEKIVELYAENGRIHHDVAAQIKGDLMQSFFAFYRQDGAVRLIQFRLDRDWYDSIRQAAE